MKEETLAKKIAEQAKKFKLRANRGHDDNKRHDLVRPDERKVMYTAYDKLEWSYAKIGSVFDRDARTVKQYIEQEQSILTKHKEVQHSEELSIPALTPASNIDPAFAEVRKDPIQLAHLKALRMFLQEDSRIRESFSVEAPGHGMERILKLLVPRRPRIWLWEGNLPWETLPIVSKIKSHCPENQLWRDIDEWKTGQHGYSHSILNIAKKLQAEFQVSLHSPRSEINDPALECRLLLDIFNWLAGQLLGNVPHYYGGFHTYVIIQQGKMLIDNIPPNDRGLYNALKGQIAWGDTYYAQGTVEQIERARRAAEDVLKQWSDSDDMRSLVRQFYSLENLAQRIRNDIEHIDEAVLAQGNCPDCLILRS